MYNLPYHKEKDPAAVRAVIRQFPFAFLSGCDAGNRPVATQVPLLLDDHQGKEVLIGHIMRNTDHHKAFLQNENVLAVFTGKHTYVSGTWYSDPHTPSTWNFMSVHVRGRIRFLEEGALEAVLRKTTLHFENNDAGSSTVYDNIPDAFLDKYMPAIVAFRLEELQFDNVFKLSQDRDRESYGNIISHLRQQGENGKFIADEMEKRSGEVFPDET